MLPEALKRVLDGSSDGALVIDDQHRILYANDAYARLAGLRPAELGRRVREGTRCFEQLPLGICAAGCAMELARSAGCAARLDEISTARAVGEPLRLSVRAVPLPGIGYLETYRDVTSEARVQERYGVLLRAVDETLAPLVAGLAHELESTKRSVRIEAIREEAHRAASLVSQLRTYSGAGERRWDAVSLADGIRETLRHTAELCGDRITLESSIDELPPVQGDAGQLKQLLVNLLTNAVQATPGPGTVAVEARRRGDSVEIAVIDHGVGVDPAVLPRIFEPFFTTRPPGQSVGLGLSVSQSIASEHGGTIRVEPTPGGGATFLVQLPLVAICSAAS